MKVIKYLLAVLMTLVVYGCGTTRESVMDSWVGSSIDELTEKWGAPSKSFARKDGGYTYTWIEFNGQSQCSQTFITDINGKIQSWSYNGCSARVRTY